MKTIRNVPTVGLCFGFIEATKDLADHFPIQTEKSLIAFPCDDDGPGGERIGRIVEADERIIGPVPNMAEMSYLFYGTFLPASNPDSACRMLIKSIKNNPEKYREHWKGIMEEGGNA